MATEYRNYVGGSWISAESGDTFTVRNPADTTDVVGEFPQSGREDARNAIAAAVDAQSAWADTPAPERGRILRATGAALAERTEELGTLLAREEGKTLAEATGEVRRASDIFYYYAEKARDVGGTVKSPSRRDATLYTVQEPVGVAALITPWNYPIAIPAWKLAPALATGNAAILKPASAAPAVARELFACLDEAGLPDGVANYVTGPGSAVGDELATSDDVDALSFTGSTAVGTALYREATEDRTRVQCEMGGKNPTVVMPSADLDEAAEIVGTGAFGVTGQACTACSRAIVHESVASAFVDRIVDYAEGIDVGPALEGSGMGPQVSDGERESTLEYIDVGTSEGATLATGGAALTDGRFADGHFVAPTVFVDVEPDMRIAQEEIFGPVLSVIEVPDFATGLTVANGVDYGLSASIVTNDHAEAEQFVDEIEAGVAKINQKTPGVELHVPFGGFKHSSSETIREQGDAGLDFYTLSKTVYDNW